MVLRYFNATGADPDGEIGEQHEPETHLIPLAIGAALAQRASLEIYGTDYLTADGTAVRDYVHVTDLAHAHAHVLALEHLRKNDCSIALNLGTGRGHSVLEVAAAIERVSQRALPMSKQPRRAGDPAALVADASRANQLLNWQPRYSSLDTVVETAWRWHSSRVSATRVLDFTQ